MLQPSATILVTPLGKCIVLTVSFPLGHLALLWGSLSGEVSCSDYWRVTWHCVCSCIIGIAGSTLALMRENVFAAFQIVLRMFIMQFLAELVVI